MTDLQIAHDRAHNAIARYNGRAGTIMGLDSIVADQILGAIEDERAACAAACQSMADAIGPGPEAAACDATAKAILARGQP